ncbi:hypothetical protein VKT23_004527 [Stygiomarasmius scandens]|uniref:Chromo domain-containing protein n=1 Tax=Marasmiellus scandens TaxID=2682957 RepID=A0ABR1JUC1_9AGAR
MGRAKKKIKVEEEEGKIYEVEVVTAARVTEEGEWEYLVKWHGYDSNEDSWEPDRNLGNCSRLLNAFWKEVGTDNDDYKPGYTCQPTDEWIKKERKRAAKNFSYDKKAMEKRAQKEREQTRKAAKKADKETLVDFIDDDLTPKRRSSSKGKGKEKMEPPVGSRNLSRKRKRDDSPDADESSSGSEDTPLAISILNRKKKSGSARTSADSRETSTSGSLEKKASKKQATRAGSANAKESSEGAEKRSKAENKPNPQTEHPQHAGPSQSKTKDQGEDPSDPNSLFSDNESELSPPSKKDPPDSNKSKKPSLAPLSIPKPESTKAPSSVPLDKSTPTSALPTKQRSIQMTSGPASAGAGSVPLLPGRTGTKSATSTPNILPKTPAFIQQSNGKDLKDLNVGSGSNLSTKQRLAQMAMTPQNPREQLQGTSRKNAYGGLSFKKQQSTGTVGSTLVPDSPVTPSHSVTLPAPAVPQDPRLRKTSSTVRPPAPVPTSIASVDSNTGSITDMPMIQSPVDDVDGLFDEAPATFEEVPGLESNLVSPTVHPKSDDANLEAQNFLDNMILPEPSASSSETSQVKAPTPRTSIFLPSNKIQRKWKWTGKIELEHGEKAEILCEQAILTDTTQVVSEGMPFVVAMPASTTTLKFRSFFRLGHVDNILLACKPVQQLACLSAEDEAGKTSLNKLAGFMLYKQLCLLVPILLDQRHVAQVLFFPPKLAPLLRRFQIPSEYSRTAILVAALLPWSVAVSERPPDWLRPYKDRLEQAQLSRKDSQQSNSEPKSWQESLAKRSPFLNDALRVLQYPYWLHSYMGFADRTYCIWSDERKFKTKDLETELLQSVLRTYRDAVQSTTYQLKLKAIFIHVSSLPSLSKIPSLVDLRTQTMETMFILFGTSPYDSHYRGGFHEIYPIGGIMTFTASALVEDPISIFERICEVDDHQLWLGYIIPSVLGLAVKLHYGEEDPLLAFDRGQFVFRFLLTAIDEGKIALMRAPPQRHTCIPSTIPRDTVPRKLEDWKEFSSDLLRQGQLEWKSDTDDWVMAQTESIIRSPRDILEYCINEFQVKYANVSESQWHSTLEREISADLEMMQIQPAIMHEYRRFVVLKAERDQHIEYGRGGFEWTTCSAFKFNDQSDDPATI